MLAKTRPLSRVPLRLALLVAWIVLLNAWVLLQFGIELKAIFFIEAAIGLAAFLMKALTKRDNVAVQIALQRAFYGLLRTPVLLTAYAVFAVLTLMVSAVVVQGAGAEKTCVRRGRGGCASALVNSDDKAIFVMRVGNPTAQFGDSEAVTLQHRPWWPTTRSVSDFPFPPVVLVRVGYPMHFALAGGEIEVRDRTTNKVLASAKTSVDSAALLLGRNVSLTADVIAEWDADLAGLALVPAQKARNRWRKCLLPPSGVKLAKDQKLEAVFRTGAFVIAAREEFEVTGGIAIQDVVMKRVSP
jgi:hypothetical protein